MDDWTLLASVAALWALAVVSPGPNFLMTARLAMARSRRAGLQAVGGIAIGALCWAAAGCFGVQALFLAAPWMHLAIKAAGALYLILVGGQMLWRSFGRAGDLGAPLAAGAPRMSPFHIGLLTTLANPRSAVSVASIFAATMPGRPAFALAVEVMALMVAISAAWYAAVAFVFAAPYLAGRYRRARCAIDRVAGACLIGFGARLAVEP
jgi:threonine efflux protein